MLVNTEQTVKCQEGERNCKVAFVFSCPGKKEFEVGCPCAYQTGANLEMLIKLLHSELEEIFPSEEKKYYLITNASNIVHYRALTGDTEPSNAEIALPSNIQRLKEELCNMQYIITMGEKAEFAIKMSFGNSKETYKCMHLGFQAINRKFSSISLTGKTPKDRTIERLQKIAVELIQQIGHKFSAKKAVEYTAASQE